MMGAQWKPSPALSDEAKRRLAAEKAAKEAKKAEKKKA
jgi:hypothetical protein